MSFNIIAENKTTIICGSIIVIILGIITGLVGLQIMDYVRQKYGDNIIKLAFIGAGIAQWAALFIIFFYIQFIL
jgi:uncharacterized membrane-anchored protein